MRVSYAIVFVSDMQASVAFYRDVLDMPLRFESPGCCRPGLRVSDLDAFHECMLAMNVRCLHPPTVTFGNRIAQYGDPDGLGISVGEG